MGFPDNNWFGKSIQRQPEASTPATLQYIHQELIHYIQVLDEAAFKTAPVFLVLQSMHQPDVGLTSTQSALPFSQLNTLPY